MLSLNVFFSDQFYQIYMGLSCEGVCQFVQKVLHCWAGWSPRFENIWKIFLTRTKKFWGWILVYNIGDKVYKVCSNDDPRMTFDRFTAQSIFCPSCCSNTERTLQSIFRYAMADLLRWANRGPWTSYHFFSPGGHSVQPSETILSILVKGYMSNISVKSFWNQATGIGGEVV